MMNQISPINSKLKYQAIMIFAFACFSTWLLGFLFDAQHFVDLFDQGLDVYRLTLGMVFIHGVGFLFWVFIINSHRKATLFYPISILVLLILGLQFFTQYKQFWIPSYIASGFIMSGTMVSNAYYIKAVSRKCERFKIVAWLLVVSYILLFFFDLINNFFGAYISFVTAYGLLIMSLIGAYLLLKLPHKEVKKSGLRTKLQKQTRKDLTILSIIIFIITINGGLLTQYIFPSYQTLGDAVNHYWLWPYIIGVVGSAWLYLKYNRGNLIFSAVSLIGLSFVSYMILPHGFLSFFIVVTIIMLPLGALDLFWWGTLSEMLEDTLYPGFIFGIGMFANIMGVFFGGLLSGLVQSSLNSTVLLVAIALSSVLVVVGILPFVNHMLSSRNHLQNRFVENVSPNESLLNNPKIEEAFQLLSEREVEITLLLLQGKTYKRIGEELFISVNTVKYYIKSIYVKLNIKSRFELIEQFEEFLIH
jgi:DNA-binding CsgD family transcriptional regulator